MSRVSSLWLRAGFASGVALALTASALPGGAQMLIEEIHNTNADVVGNTFAGSASDADIAPGDGRAESYAEVTGEAPVPFKWFASGLAGAGVLNAVGVDLTRPACCVIGAGNAFAVSEFLLDNDTDQWLTNGMSGVYIPEGEILFMTGPYDPVAGAIHGFFDVTVVAFGVGPIFNYRLELETTDGGFEEVERTGNVVVDEVFDGAGGVWGYTIGATDFDFPVPDVAPYGQLRLTHYMQAYGYTNFHNGEVGAGFSVKLGDPLQPVSGRSLRLPEPGAALLLGASLPGLAWLLARRRRA